MESLNVSDYSYSFPIHAVPFFFFFSHQFTLSPFSFSSQFTLSLFLFTLYKLPPFFLSKTNEKILNVPVIKSQPLFLI